MTGYFVFFLWIIFNSLILNIAVKTGWDHDPGYLAPFLIMFMLNIVVALYNAKKSD